MTSSTVLSTYRLQLTPDFGFAAAADLVDYVAGLGVSHLYLSPLLTAREGSTHGYDVADPTTVSAALGGEEGLRALAERARAAGLGLVVDIVPNHLGTGADNPLWETLLAEGQNGFGGRVFDVDWEPRLPTASGKVVLPVLGDQYGVVLHRGELSVEEVDGEPRVRYYERTFPLSPETREALGRSGGVEAFAGTVGHEGSFQRLHALLEAQHYRLVHWRAGPVLINYRRFFAIDELAAVRVEDEAVFERTHGKVLELVADGVVDGLRVDHPDGLRDPAGYFSRLAEATGGVWTVAEKILESGEALPDWPVAGTTGYELANDVLGLFVDPAAREELDALDVEMGGDPRPYAQQAAEAKAEVLAADLAADTRRLARRLWALTQEHVEVRDVDDRACLDAVSALLVALPVYRTYVDPETGEARPEDAEIIAEALEPARAAAGASAFLVDFLADVILGRASGTPAHRELTARFQQLSGAAMAKGVEDTVFYRYRRLLAVNEVGGDPSRLGLDAEDFHARSAERARRTPAAMVTTATHDTKRGEDTRLRMAALSELAADWGAAVRRWHAAHVDLVADTPRGPAPDAQTELVCYQTLVGVWPGSADAIDETLRDRVVAYLEKAGREAKQRTTWTDADEAFETGVAAFVDALLLGEDGAAFREEMDAIAGRAAAIATTSGLAQTLLRATVPGVPDTYQGAELLDTSLVDPDNRRPVDYAARREVLAALDADPPDPAALLAAGDGRAKLWVLSRALRARRDRPGTLGPDAAYEPLDVAGPAADHVVAFARIAPGGEDAAVVVVPRLPGGLGDGGQPPLGEAWAGTTVALPGSLAGSGWTDLLGGPGHAAGERLDLPAVLADLPVALLVSGRPGGDGA